MGKTYCLFVPWIPNQTFESHAAHFGIPIDYIILKSGVGSKYGYFWNMIPLHQPNLPNGTFLQPPCCGWKELLQIHRHLRIMGIKDKIYFILGKALLCWSYSWIPALHIGTGERDISVVTFNLIIQDKWEIPCYRNYRFCLSCYIIFALL